MNDECSLDDRIRQIVREEINASGAAMQVSNEAEQAPDPSEALASGVREIREIVRWNVLDMLAQEVRDGIRAEFRKQWKE